MLIHQPEAIERFVDFFWLYGRKLFSYILKDAGLLSLVPYYSQICDRVGCSRHSPSVKYANPYSSLTECSQYWLLLAQMTYLSNQTRVLLLAQTKPAQAGLKPICELVTSRMVITMYPLFHVVLHG